LVKKRNGGNESVTTESVPDTKKNQIKNEDTLGGMSLLPTNGGKKHTVRNDLASLLTTKKETPGGRLLKEEKPRRLGAKLEDKS